MEVTELSLFPSKVLSIQFTDVDDLNRDLYQMFETANEFQSPEFLAVSDETDLLDRADKHPCIARLHGMFLDGLARWLKSEKVLGRYRVESFLFPNYAHPGQYTIAHNHEAHVVGIYYVKTASAGDPAKPRLGYASPWDLDSGALYLLDPRFNSSLTSLADDTYFKVLPQAGQMLIFASYVWHSVTPNLEKYRRLAISVNFNVETLPTSTGAAYSELTIE